MCEFHCHGKPGYAYTTRGVSCAFMLLQVFLAPQKQECYIVFFGKQIETHVYFAGVALVALKSALDYKSELGKKAMEMQGPPNVQPNTTVAVNALVLVSSNNSYSSHNTSTPGNTSELSHGHSIVHNNTNKTTIPDNKTLQTMTFTEEAGVLDLNTSANNTRPEPQNISTTPEQKLASVTGWALSNSNHSSMGTAKLQHKLTHHFSSAALKQHKVITKSSLASTHLNLTETLLHHHHMHPNLSHHASVRNFSNTTHHMEGRMK
jgi:hypothetical protein